MLIATITLLTACGPTNVLVSADYPEPLTAPMPLNGGIIFDEAFSQYIYVDETGSGLTVAIGDSQTALFSEVLGEMFDTLAVVETLEQSKTQNLDLIIAPHVENIQIALPRDTRLEIFEFWIKYNIQVFDGTGAPIADWIMTSYGKTMNKFMDSKKEAINQAAVVALRDTGAQLVTKFHLAPGVKEWLQARQTETVTGADNE